MLGHDIAILRSLLAVGGFGEPGVLFNDDVDVAYTDTYGISIFALGRQQVPGCWRCGGSGHHHRTPPEEQYQERFCQRRLDGICLDVVTKEFLTIKIKFK